MISKIALVATLFAVAHAGHEAPPPKAHVYSVPSVAKVSYPAPTIAKTVSTYSAPSIEKTTTIIRTITAPLNAPPVKTIQYSAPAAPVVAKAVAPAYVYNAPGFAAPVAQYANPAAVYTAAAYDGHHHNVVAQPTLAVAVPGYSGSEQQLLAYAPGAYAGNAYATAYGSPSVGYQLGHYAAAAPVVAKAVATDYGH